MLGGGGLNGCAQRRGQLALLVNRLGHHQTAVAQLAQIRQTRFQLAQLNVVQPVGHLFAVAGDKGHGGAPVEQGHSGLDLAGTNSNFLRDLRDDFLHSLLACPSAGARLGGRVRGDYLGECIERLEFTGPIRALRAMCSICREMNRRDGNVRANS